MKIDLSKYAKHHDELIHVFAVSFLDKCFKQAMDVKYLIDSRKEFDEKCAEYANIISSIEAEINRLANSKTRKDRDLLRYNKDLLKATATNLNTFKIAQSDLYKIVAEKARKIEEDRQELEERQAWTGEIPQLPFVEIEGTRYKATADNRIDTNEKGEKILFIDNDQETNKAKEGANK